MFWSSPLADRSESTSDRSAAAVSLSRPTSLAVASASAAAAASFSASEAPRAATCWSRVAMLASSSATNASWRLSSPVTDTTSSCAAAMSAS